MSSSFQIVSDATGSRIWYGDPPWLWGLMGWIIDLVLGVVTCSPFVHRRIGGYWRALVGWNDPVGARVDVKRFDSQQTDRHIWWWASSLFFLPGAVLHLLAGWGLSEAPTDIVYCPSSRWLLTALFFSACGVGAFAFVSAHVFRCPDGPRRFHAHSWALIGWYVGQYALLPKTAGLKCVGMVLTAALAGRCLHPIMTGGLDPCLPPKEVEGLYSV